MIKTGNLTKTFYDTNPQPIRLFTPSTASSSGSTYDTEPSSANSSFKSGIGINDDIIPISPQESSATLINIIEKLKRELATVKQAKNQLAALYKVKCKSDLDKSAKITKLRLQFEYELNTFCKQDQKDLVCYLQRQLLSRDQRITELSYDIEQLKTNILINSENEQIKKKIEPIQILRCNDPDLVISTNRRLYDEQDRILQRQNIELNDRMKKFEKQLEVLKNNQLKDHDKELIKRALSKQAIEYNKILTKKTEEIQQLNERVKQLSQSNPYEAALRQSNIERLLFEKRLLSSTSSMNSTTTTNAVQTTNGEHLTSPRSTTSSISLTDSTDRQTFDEMNSENNSTKLKTKFDELQQTYNQLDIKYKELLNKNEYEINKLKQEHLDELNKQKEQIHLLETKIVNNNEEYDLEKFEQNIKERETISMLNTKLGTELTDATNTNKRLTDESEKLRTALISKSNEFDSKQRENEELKVKNSELESKIKSLQNTNDSQQRLIDENETNKEKLKKNQDDFEQFQKMHDTTQREHQTIINQLQEKIHELERRTELQSLKHEEILNQLESLKTRHDRQSPSLNGSEISSNNNLPNMSDSKTSLKDDSAPIYPNRRSTDLNEKSPQIVLAKYSYEPLKSSPNEHPEIELPLKNGQFYLIYGEIDEDGFYDGRNLEGRYGLIPSNFIELVRNPNDIPENTKYLINKLTGKTISPNREQNSNSLQQQNNTSSSDVSTDNLTYGNHIPHPTNLHVEKFLTNSLLIVWNPPVTNLSILGYQVLLDHSLYTTSRLPDSTRVLIENIHFNQTSHRISVRTITQHGLSRDQECTLLISNTKDLSPTPTDLRVDKITQTSAIVSWWPGSNDIIHKLYVNDIEIQTLKPGVYRFKLSGLLPNTIHKVTIKAKPSDMSNTHQKLSTSTEFRTNPFDELVDPPHRVQVSNGQQSNTLYVTWEKPSITHTVRGYRILIDDRHIQDINNPLNDNSVIKTHSLHHGKFLTMRTLTENGGESRDSNRINLDDILRKSSRSLSTISHESAPLIKSTINEIDINKTKIQSPLDSPSITSSINIETPQIEINSTNSLTSLENKPINHFESNQILTPTNEKAKNQFISSDEKQTKSTNENNDLNKKLNSQPRLFAALFDYDPKAMSPNQNSEEELPFKEGQIIKIFGDQDSDGFYIGQIENGPTGYVPSNMVSEIKKDDSEIESNKSSVVSRKPAEISSINSKPNKKMTALYDYNPNDNSPNKNHNDELEFHSGDIIYIDGDIRDDGFYSGQLENGKKGLVPSNYLKEISDEKTTENKQSKSNVNDEKPTETSTSGFFDQLKNTFSFNSNEPI